MPTDLVAGKRYKMFWREHNDPNQWYAIGTYEGRTPTGGYRFTNLEYYGGERESVTSISPNDEWLEEYTLVPVESGGRRRRARHTRRRRVVHRKRRSTRRH